jgi:hypothetical protein
VAGADDSVSELIEQVGRDAGTLVFRELQLAGSRQVPAARRTGKDLAVAAVAIVALATAFALANWAAVAALSDVLPGWLAALVLAAAWAAVGIVLLVVARRRLRAHGTWGGAALALGERERMRDEAEAELRRTLDRLAEAIAAEAQARARDAVESAADSVLDVGEELLDAADDLTDTVEAAVPGGSLVNGVLDLVLLPGRTFVRVARVVTVREVTVEEDRPDD